MNSNQKTILKAALLMPIMVPLGYIEMAWHKIFPKKSTTSSSIEESKGEYKNYMEWKAAQNKKP
jgi:hypothetical protein